MTGSSRKLRSVSTLRYGNSMPRCFRAHSLSWERLISNATHPSHRAHCEQRVTILQVVPTLLGMLLEHPDMQQCRTLRRVFCGGEALTVELCQQFAERLPTLSCTTSTGQRRHALTPHGGLAEMRDGNSHTAPIGRPIANTQIYLLDRHLEPVPVGVPGGTLHWWLLPGAGPSEWPN